MIDFGLDAQTFVKTYLDKLPYLHRRALRDRSFAWSDVDELLPTVETEPSAIKLFRNGELAPQTYLEESNEFGRITTRLNKHRFYSLLESGTTLVINQIERYLLLARRLGIQVSRFTGMQTTSNAYISFGGSGTFGKHWDTHDVVVIQLLGTKRWQVFAPSWPLPLVNQTSERMQLPCPSTPELDITLETGDLLYIPRGWWHHVTPEHQGSMHLSIGVYGHAIADYLIWLCSHYLPRHLDARLHARSDALQVIPELLKILEAAGLNKNNLAEFCAEVQQRSRLIGEYHTELFSHSATALPDEAELVLTALTNDQNDPNKVRINGGWIKLDTLGRNIIDVLGRYPCATFGQLCVQLAHCERAKVSDAVLSLARHELINITLSSSSS